MFDFFKTLFKKESSSVTAKERLRLVLLSDHISLAPEIVVALKADLLSVIARYVDFDPAQADVSFEHRDVELALLASIPILGLRDERGERIPAAVVQTPVLPAGAAAAPEAAQELPLPQPKETPQAADESPGAPPPAREKIEALGQKRPARKSRRRRRKVLPGAVPAYPATFGGSAPA